MSMASNSRVLDHCPVQLLTILQVGEARAGARDHIHSRKRTESFQMPPAHETRAQQSDLESFLSHIS